MTERAAFSFDMTPYLDAEGKLTGAGLVALRAKMLADFERRFPLADKSRLAQTVEGIIEGVAGKRPADVHLSLKIRALGGILDRTEAALEGMDELLIELAQHISLLERQAGPHVFGCGMAAALVQLARGAMKDAKHQLELILNCKDCADDAAAPSGVVN